MVLSGRGWREAIGCGLLAFLVQVIIEWSLISTHQSIDSDFLKTMITATGGLLAFGAIILPITYPASREILKDLKSEIAKWQARIRLYPPSQEILVQWNEDFPDDIPLVTPFKSMADSVITNRRSRVNQMTRDRAFVLAGFLVSLGLWASDLVLELIHLSLLRLLSPPTPYSWLGSILVAFEFFLITAGLAIFLITLYRSVVLTLAT